jgi:hypothetical protein
MTTGETAIPTRARTLERLIAAAQRRRAFRDAFELTLVAIAFLLYFLVRGAVVDREADALRNAEWIIDLQRALGIYWEPWLQAQIIDVMPLVHFFNFVYFWLDFPLIIVVGFWLYFTRRHEFTVARDALLLSGAIALVIYHTFPVMPPRLLPGGEFIGTVEAYAGLSYQAQSTEWFVNPYAAVPSLHFGWTLILGAVIFLTAKNLFVRGVGLLLPWAQLAAIVFTANHFILDAVAGLVVALAGVLLAMAMQRWVYPAVRREVDRRWGAPAPAPAALTTR